jgi:hypothetical protein
MGTKYTIKDDGKGNYEVTEHEEKSTAELIEESRKLIEYNKRQKEKEAVVPKQEQKPNINQVKKFQSLVEEAESQARVNKHKQVYIPRTIFDAFDY